MIIRITSDNPHFLDLLRKNPATFGGFQLREHKNGVAIGRIISNSEYHMVFQDTKYSYSKDTSNQIDFQSYCNPRAALGLVGVFLRHTLISESDWSNSEIPWLEKTVEEVDDDEYHHRIVIDNIYADGFSKNRGFVLAKYFNGVKLIHLGGNQYRLEVAVTSTLHRAINLAAFVMMYIAATNKQSWFLNKDLANKYIKVMENIKHVPYFVLYLFARSALPTEALFDEFRPRLEALLHHELHMKYGNTQTMRINQIRSMIIEDGTVNTNIVEIGCSDGDYPRKLARKLSSGLSWWSHDVDDYGYLNSYVPEKMSDDTSFTFTQSFDEVPVQDNTTVLMVEVIEHMEIDEAKQLIASVINKHQPDRIIITTPNRTFNRWYKFDELGIEFRHADHKFEFTTPEFANFIKNVMTSNGYYSSYSTDFFGIGDSIDSEFTSNGVDMRRI